MARGAGPTSASPSSPSCCLPPAVASGAPAALARAPRCSGARPPRQRRRAPTARRHCRRCRRVAGACVGPSSSCSSQSVTPAASVDTRICFWPRYNVVGPGRINVVGRWGRVFQRAHSEMSNLIAGNKKALCFHTTALGTDRVIRRCSRRGARPCSGLPPSP